MNAHRGRLGMAALAALLVCALVMPSAAMAIENTSGGRIVAASNTSHSSSSKGRASQKLKREIAAVLAKRKARYDAASAAINAGIARVSALADKVQAAGGDVTKVRASLRAAKKHLSKAGYYERRAVSKFKGVPRASNKKSALAQARKLGRSSEAQLKAARADLKRASRQLSKIIDELKGSKSSLESGLASVL